MELDALKRLALLGASGGQISLSSSMLAEALGTSIQTAARRLASLEEEGYIDRIVTSSGQKVKITDGGMLRLKQEYMDYQKIFFGGEFISKIKGKVASGLGEGQYYIALEGYSSQFRQKLGFEPFPGTLNLLLTEPFAQGESNWARIEGFKDQSRTYGGCQCFPGKIGGIPCAVVRPERTSYPPRLVEIIAPANLRKTLGLKDGDEVEVVLG